MILLTRLLIDGNSYVTSAGIKNVQSLNSFFTRLAYYSGNEISSAQLLSSSTVDSETLRKYLVYLEAAFLIKQVYRIDECARKFKKTHAYKVYLTNPSQSVYYLVVEDEPKKRGSYKNKGESGK